VTDFVEPPSYYALRVSPGVQTTRWWTCARAAGSSAPAAIRALLAGRARVEVSADEAAHVLAWARTLDGWAGDGAPPLRVHPEPAA
jgi:hypothetical protein